jgi:ring-1,2-phenylacetyl-CoA epoxidase subunit PaaD
VTSPRDVVARVVDPELRVVTIEELGILRDVSVAPDTGRVTVTIRPTYSGCPAMDTIRDDITDALRQSGHPDAEVRTVLSPAWSTDDITESGRAKLAAAGIAPPGHTECGHCGSPSTVEISRFGSTPCKALWRCRACAEPFERIKAF